MTYRRFVALGDSTTEGLEDPAPGGGYRGWADRLADRLADADPQVQYANLAIRGRKVGQIVDEQLEPAAAMEPDLASVIAGVNDILRPRCDLDQVLAQIEQMQARLRAGGATVIGLTFPDLTGFMPVARVTIGRILAYNDGMRTISARTGSLLVDFGREPSASDPRLWHVDRLHPSPEGHRRIADAVAAALELPGADDAWKQPLPPAPPRSRAEVAVSEVDWVVRHAAPWIGRRLRGVSSGDGLTPKRPQLAPVRSAA